MSDGVIKLNEEIDQVIRLLDGVVGSYTKGGALPKGLSEGAAEPFYLTISDNQEIINQRFDELDTSLRKITEALRASVADHRATEEEISDELRRLLGDIVAVAHPTPPSSATRLSPIPAAVPDAGAASMPNGSK